MVVLYTVLSLENTRVFVTRRTYCYYNVFHVARIQKCQSQGLVYKLLGHAQKCPCDRMSPHYTATGFIVSFTVCAGAPWPSFTACPFEDKCMLKGKWELKKWDVNLRKLT